MNTPESCYFGALKRALEGDLEGAFSLQEKAEEAREAHGYSFSEAVSESFPFVEEVVTTLLSSYDFTRCVRADGTAYGTRGRCKKGSQQSKTVTPGATGKKAPGAKGSYVQDMKKMAGLHKKHLEKPTLRTEQQVASHQDKILAREAALMRGNKELAEKVLAHSTNAAARTWKQALRHLRASEKVGRTDEKHENAWSGLDAQSRFHQERARQAREILGEG